MLRSSEKEDDTHLNSNTSKITKFLKDFKSWFCYWKSKDNFYYLIKKLEINSKKMSVEQTKIFQNLIDFGNKTVEDVMIPRSDIKAVKLTASFEELSKIYSSKAPHTRILVYDDTLDNIVGFIHIKDLFRALVNKQEVPLKKIMRKPIISASSMKLIDLLAEMRRTCVQISIVVDEYGGTDGIVTIEDIMEEIVGNIEDEHDKKSDSNNLKVISKDTIISNARVEVEELELLLGVKLKTVEDEFDTIGGLVLAKIGNVPSIGTKIDIAEQVELEVIDANPRVLKQVKLKLKNGLTLPKKK
ncbi:MAG: hemolysin family protein [Rickettsia endosymbiont of Bryobia graminum]|nr:hemolysin family protein [Rickettsia endosymbiont of Bryobia graminum]